MRLDKAKYLELYRTMLRIRLAERRVSDIYPTDKIQSPIHLSIGQEAVAAGLCAALKPSDHLHGTYRGHAAFIAKGGEMRKLFAEFYGKDTGCTRGKGGSMHLTAPEVGLLSASAIVGSTIPVATGDALASKMQGRKWVVATIFGDGAIDEGVFFESVNFAVLKKLPILYVLENNNYAVHSRVADRHAQPQLHRIAQGLGLPGKRFDGSDVAVVYRAVSDAVGSLRRSGGPMLLEFMVYRWFEHVGHSMDFAEKYRRPGEQALAKKHDPLLLAERVLRSRYKVPAATFANMEREATAEIDDAVRFAEESPLPSTARLMSDLYAA